MQVLILCQLFWEIIFLRLNMKGRNANVSTLRTEQRLLIKHIQLDEKPREKPSSPVSGGFSDHHSHRGAVTPFWLPLSLWALQRCSVRWWLSQKFHTLRHPYNLSSQLTVGPQELFNELRAREGMSLPVFFLLSYLKTKIGRDGDLIANISSLSQVHIHASTLPTPHLPTPLSGAGELAI